MTIGRSRRSAVERMLLPNSVAVFGAETEAGRRVLANIRAGGFAGEVAAPGKLDGAPDLALIASEGPAARADLATLASAGGAAAVLLGRMATFFVAPSLLWGEG